MTKRRQEGLIAEAGAYRRPDAFYLHAEGRTSSGLWVPQPPFLRLELSTEDHQLGDAIRAVLISPPTTIEHPRDDAAWKQLALPLYQAAGVKTWRSFAKRASFCSIELEPTIVRFSPRVNLFSHGESGFGAVKGIVTVPDSEPDLLGSTLRRCLQAT
jgi:hypothetical protein